MLCGYCKAILETALQCPNCEKIMINGYTVTWQSHNPLYRLLYLFRRGYEQTVIECAACKYKGNPDEFNPIVIFEETYSVIEF